MIAFRALNGKTAGSTWKARRFPVRIGRAAGMDLQLEQSGVWDQHLAVEFVPKDGFRLKATAQAVVRVNGEPREEAILRNGDLLEIGEQKLQFWLSETRQSTLGLREALTWLGIGAVTVGQVALLYWLLLA